MVIRFARVLSLVVISAAVLLPSRATLAQQLQEFGPRAFSANKSVSLTVPHGWTARTIDLPRGVILFLQSPKEGPSDSFTENLFVNEDRLAEKNSLGDYVNFVVSEMRRSYDGFRVLSDDQIQLSGRPARSLVFQYRIQGVTAIQISNYLEKNGTAFSATGTTLQSEYERWGQKLRDVCRTLRVE